MEEKIRLAVFGQKRLSREGGISNRRKERERTMRRFSSRNEHARTDNP